MTISAQDSVNIDSVISSFGEAQVWTPAGGAAMPFTGIAEVGFKQMDLLSGAVVTHDAAVVGSRSALGAAKKGDVVTLTSALNGITAVAYTVTIPQNDPDDLGPGFTRLVLRKA